MRAGGTRGPRRGIRAGRAVVTAVALAAAAVTVPPDAGAAPAPDATARHPRLDWAGSTIAAHEGRALVPSGDASTAAGTTPGLDVSAFQGNVDWASAHSKGARFAYVKATESVNYTNPSFTQQYNGSYSAGLIRGAYHFATPDTSSGTAQADYFVKHGGGWSRDGKTMPPMLDIEYNPYGGTCFGKSQAAMVTWIRSFLTEAHAKTKRWPVIYTTTDWWRTCTGDSPAFAAQDPLFTARYAASAGALPKGWSTWTIWQFADSGTFPGDQDRFNGDLTRVRALANNT